jgi:hypothetical protein
LLGDVSSLVEADNQQCLIAAGSTPRERGAISRVGAKPAIRWSS